MDPLADTVSTTDQVWVLSDPLRRALYRFVASSQGGVSRDEAAEALTVPRHVAKFHLDKLEAHGLLDVDYRRPEGLGGPGAGRPTKWYRCRHSEVSASVPERHYDILGEVLAAALDVAAQSGVDITPTLSAVAAARGEQVGAATGDIQDALTATGYEPRAVDGDLVLDNCPFHHLAQSHTELVCAINYSFVQGIIDASASPTGFKAHLRPRPDGCCVQLTRQR